MKRSTFIKTVLAGLMIFTLTSCHDAIFNTIMDEVSLNKNGINGDISKIVRYKDGIVLANGNIYFKAKEETGSWTKTDTSWLPEKDSFKYQVPSINWIASDSNNLYAMVTMWSSSDGEQITSERFVYCTSDELSPKMTWTKISLPENVTNFYCIFDNQAEDASKRNAYVRVVYHPESEENSTSKIYKLNGTAVPSQAAIKYLPGESDEATLISAINFNGNDYFSKYYGLTANSKFVYRSATYTNGSNIAGSSDLYYGDPESESLTSVTTDSNYILDMAVTKDYLLIGSSTGLKRIALNAEKVPASAITAFSNNGNTVITEYVMYVFALEPAKDMDNTNLYASSVIYGSITGSSDTWDDTGLYACFNGESWNRN